VAHHRNVTSGLLSSPLTGSARGVPRLSTSRQLRLEVEFAGSRFGSCPLHRRPRPSATVPWANSPDHWTTRHVCLSFERFLLYVSADVQLRGLRRGRRQTARTPMCSLEAAQTIRRGVCHLFGGSAGEAWFGHCGRTYATGAAARMSRSYSCRSTMCGATTPAMGCHPPTSASLRR